MVDYGLKINIKIPFDLLKIKVGFVRDRI